MVNNHTSGTEHQRERGDHNLIDFKINMYMCKCYVLIK